MKFTRYSATAASVVMIATLMIAGCKSTQDQPTAQTGVDPAAANLAPVTGGDQTVDPNAAAAQPTVDNSQQAAAPAPRSRRSPRRNEEQGNYDNSNGPDRTNGYGDSNYRGSDRGYGSNDGEYSSYDQNYQPLPVTYASQPPPPLPQYEQPSCPGEGYLWTPGYWAYSPQGYYWTPGAWVAPPYRGALWTPGYWGFNSGRYGFHGGYWGNYVGFYGGISYGFGYTGRGYEGGYWNDNAFYYNRAVNNVTDTRITNVYEHQVTINNNTTINNVSYNGQGGVMARPTIAEIAAVRAPHVPPMTQQIEQQRAAASNRAQFAAVNNGRPALLVAARPLAADHNIVPPAPAAIHAAVQTTQQHFAPRPVQPAPVARPMMPTNRPAVPTAPNRQVTPAPPVQPHPSTQVRPAPPAQQTHPIQSGHPNLQARPAPAPPVRQMPTAPTNSHQAPQAQQRQVQPTHPQAQQRPAPAPIQHNPVQQVRPQPQQKPAPAQVQHPQAQQSHVPAQHPQAQQSHAPAQRPQPNPQQKPNHGQQPEPKK